MLTKPVYFMDEPVHVMDLIIFCSSLRINPSTYRLIFVHIMDHNFLFILSNEPILSWICNYDSMCGWTRPFYGFYTVL